jgi:tetratricopeptide (TPR) repeat protein
MRIGKCLVFLFLASLMGAAQTTPATPEGGSPTIMGAPKSMQNNDSSPAQKQATQPATPGASATQPEPKQDRASAYYHYSLAHMYEELVAIYGRPEYANKAIEEYHKAIEADPRSEYLTSGLAELYARTGRIRDAVVEAQDILKRDPNNLEAHKLLGRIYLRSLGDLQAGTQSEEILKRAIEQYEEIVKLDPKSVDSHVLLGRLYRVNNQMLKAEQEFKQAARLAPDNEEAVSMLAYLYNDEGDSAKAAAIINQVPEAQRTSKLYATLGYSYEQMKEYPHAVAAYRKAVELDRDNLDAMRGLAQNLLNNNQTDAALDEFKQIADADPHDVHTLMSMAEIYRREGKFDQALDALKRADSEVQDSQEVPYNMAVIYQAQGRFDDAIQVLQNLLSKSEKPNGDYTSQERNNRSVFLERLGSIYRDTGHTQQAIDTFRKMITLGDDAASRAYGQMIDTLRDAKRWDEATKVAEEAVQKLPKDKDLKAALAGQLADTGKPDEGVAMLKSMLNGTPEDRVVYIQLANLYSRLRRWPEAEQAIGKAQALSTRQEDKDTVNFIAGSIYERQKKYPEAEEMFKKVLADDHNNAAALNYLGYMLVDHNTRLEEALGYIRKAVELDPQNGAYLDSLGWAYYRLGNYPAAEDNLRKAVERMQNDPTVLEHMGDLLQKTGQLKQATVYWERALNEFSKSVPGDIEPGDIAKVQKKLESARVKLAEQNKAEAVKP